MVIGERFNQKINFSADRRHLHTDYWNWGGLQKRFVFLLCHHAFIAVLALNTRAAGRQHLFYLESSCLACLFGLEIKYRRKRK